MLLHRLWGHCTIRELSDKEDARCAIKRIGRSFDTGCPESGCISDDVLLTRTVRE